MIKKYKQFNEGISQYLKGPTEEEFNKYIDSMEPNELLVYSIRKKYLNGIKISVEKGARIKDDLRKALLIAVENNDMELVKTLIDFGIDINHTYWGRNALSIASDDNNIKMVKYLVEHGADVNAFRGDVLLSSVKNKTYNLTKYLVDNGADITIQQYIIFPYLHNIKSSKSKQMLEYLYNKFNFEKTPTEQVNKIIGDNLTYKKYHDHLDRLSVYIFNGDELLFELKPNITKSPQCRIAIKHNELVYRVYGISEGEAFALFTNALKNNEQFNNILKDFNISDVWIWYQLYYINNPFPKNINEGISQYLKGPTKEEVWDALGKDFFGIKKQPDTVEDFLDFIWENGKTQHEISTSDSNMNIYRWKFNNRAMFFYIKTIDVFYIYDKIYNVLNDCYDLEMDEIWNLIKEPIQEVFCKIPIKPSISLLDD